MQNILKQSKGKENWRWRRKKVRKVTRLVGKKITHTTHTHLLKIVSIFKIIASVKLSYNKPVVWWVVLHVDPLDIIPFKLHKKFVGLIAPLARKPAKTVTSRDVKVSRDEIVDWFHTKNACFTYLLSNRHKNYNHFESSDTGQTGNKEWFWYLKCSSNATKMSYHHY